MKNNYQHLPFDITYILCQFVEELVKRFLHSIRLSQDADDKEMLNFFLEEARDIQQLHGELKNSPPGVSILQTSDDELSESDVELLDWVRNDLYDSLYGDSEDEDIQSSEEEFQDFSEDEGLDDSVSMLLRFAANVLDEKTSLEGQEEGLEGAFLSTLEGILQPRADVKYMGNYYLWLSKLLSNAKVGQVSFQQLQGVCELLQRIDEVSNRLLIAHLHREQYEGQTSYFQDTYNFKNLVLGKHNREAYEAIKLIVGHRGGSILNPLIIYGPSGIGKSHLLRAMVTELSKMKVPVTYCTGGDLVPSLGEVTGRGVLAWLFERCSHSNVIVIDNLEVVGEKQEAQDLLLMLLNKLISAGRQVVLSSSVSEIYGEKFSQRLRELISNSPSIRLSEPDHETLLQIAQQITSKLDVPIPIDVLEYLTAKLRTPDVRKLDLTLKQVYLESMISGKPFDKQLIDDVMREQHQVEKETNSIYPSGIAPMVRQERRNTMNTPLAL